MYNPPERTISGKKAKLFQEGPPAVYLLEDGRFAFQKGEQWIIRLSMRSLDKAMKGVKPSLAIIPLRKETGTKVVKAISFKERKLVDVEGATHYKGWEPWALADEGLLATLNDLNKRRNRAEKEFQREYEAIVKKAKIVNETNFSDLLKKHGTTS